MTKILFIGDIVGEAGLAYLEHHLPELRDAYEPTFMVANAENLAVTGSNPMTGCGMTPQGLARLFALGIDLITGGNHSWDGSHACEVHEDPRVLRPLNYSSKAPGRGSSVIRKNGEALGVVNLASRTALPFADQPHDVLEGLLSEWRGTVDTVMVDFHGESVSEKQIFA